MNEYFLLWKDGPKFWQSEHFKLGTDSVLLADFVNTAPRRRGLDLGTGSGILPLLLLERSPKLTMTGLEINPDACKVAEYNLETNALAERGRIVCGDIKNVRELFEPGEFDLIVSNPPYFAEGSGKKSLDPARANARSEGACNLEDICAAANFLCPTGGALCLVHRAERLSDVICLVRAYGFEAKRLRFVFHNEKKEPSLFLLEAKRGAAAGVKIMPPLFVKNLDGTDSDEIKRIYHREGTT